MSEDFAEFYAARKDAVLRAVVVATGDRVGAEDAAAEAFARACARWDRVSRHPEPLAWVIRVALNVHRSWWRRLRREVLGLVPERRAADQSAGGTGTELLRLLDGLPRRQQEVVALRVLADLSAEQTAQLLGIAPATVHVHLHRALETLRGRAVTESSRRPRRP